jgi:Mn2+/Fe2+ NRAMP family transporter
VGTAREASSELVVAGLVGTTMAAVVLVSRSILVEEQGWTLADLQRENRDARVSMLLTFLISLAIMLSAAGTLYVADFRIENAIDMMNALVPVAGEFAMSLFAVGIIAAGLSSIFPNLLLFPWLLADYMDSPRQLNRPLYRLIVVAVALTGMAIPLFGGKPIWILIASQALSPFVMPLLTLFLILLLNRKRVMGEYTIGLPMNLALGATFLFNCYMLTVALSGLTHYIS